MRDRRMISTKTGDAWAYFAHCASLCFILALAVVKAPLMHDFSAVYKGSLDGAVLAAGKLIRRHVQIGSLFPSKSSFTFTGNDCFYSTRFGDAHLLLDHFVAGTHGEASMEFQIAAAGLSAGDGDWCGATVADVAATESASHIAHGRTRREWWQHDGRQHR